MKNFLRYVICIGIILSSLSISNFAQSTSLTLTTFTYGPNPFYQNTQGVFSIQIQPSVASNYEVYIFDMSRHLIFKTSGTLTTGLNTIQWNGDNLLGQEVATGPYMGIVFVRTSTELIKKRIAIGYFQ
tara:strand:+ start:453 stop:836 length:384 start_codon:yes stop_codon:yes gene_type:complete